MTFLFRVKLNMKTFFYSHTSYRFQVRFDDGFSLLHGHEVKLRTAKFSRSSIGVESLDNSPFNV